MGLARLTALALVATAAPASATPLDLELGIADGVGHARLAGWYRDDVVSTVRIGFGVASRLALDVGLSEDLDRIEAAVHAGARFRPTDLPWLYVRADVALVGASHTYSNYDLMLGGGGRFRLADHLAAYVELDGIARVGEVETLTLRVEAGVAIASAAFWRHI